MEQNMSFYNCPGSDWKITAVRTGETVKEEIHLEKGTKNKNWDDVEVVEKIEENHKTRTGNFKCDQCSFTTKWRSSVSRHMMFRHKSDEDIEWYKCTGNFKCDQCSFATIWKNSLNQHKLFRHKSDEDIEWYKCPKCPRKLKKKVELHLHLQRVHDEVKKWFTCAHCPFKTKAKRYLTNHEITRHAPSESIKWFHCMQCDDYKARTKELLQRHVKRKHTQCSCDYCPFRSKGTAALKTHEIREHEDCIKWIKCDKCGHKFKDETGLWTHNKLAHQSVEFNDRMCAMPITSEMDVLKKYSCSVCKFQTLNRVDFDTHIHKTQPDQIHLEKRKKNIHWADVEVEEAKEENPKTQRGKYKCDQCSYATNWSSSLSQHKISCHKSVEDIVWYKCPKCPKKLKFKGHLKQHLLRVHDEVKEWFTCAHCPFKAKFKYLLSHHELLRHAPSESVKWFHCTQCDDYKARTKKLVQNHVKRTHDQFFFSCDYCSYRSRRRDALKTHEIAQHDDCFKWMKCDKCGDKFKDEIRLRCHNSRSHKTGEVNEKLGAMPITSAMNILNGYSCAVCKFKTLDRVEFDKHSHQDSTNK